MNILARFGISFITRLLSGVVLVDGRLAAIYSSPTVNTDIALVALVFEPQITLVGVTELPHNTLKP
jgi:hypothetical protein